MEKSEKINGKVALKHILNMMISDDDGKEIVDDEMLESLLIQLNEFVYSEENLSKGIASKLTPERLELFNARYGLDGYGYLRSYSEVANMFNKSVERVRQADVQATRGLKRLAKPGLVLGDDIHHSR